MSLVGNLEDLGLGEILQMVYLSRQSGMLFIHSNEREATIVFKEGLVVRASSSQFPQSLGELLTQKSVIDPNILRKAISLQQSEGFLQRLGAILIKHFDIPDDVIETVVREQTECVVYSLFEWTAGRYDFQVQNQIETVYDTKMDPLQFMLNNGLNPQFLVMEGTRLLDEKRIAIGKGAYSGNEYGQSDQHQMQISMDEHRSKKPVKHPIVIVDDDAPTLQAICGLLQDNEFIVHALSRSEDTLIMIDSLIRADEHPIVIIDLIMPKMDGSGVLGGIELLELLNNNFKHLPIIVMSDYHYAEAEAKVVERGCHFLIKPRRTDINKQPDLDNFITLLLEEIQSADFATVEQEISDRYNLMEELRMEMNDEELFGGSSETANSGAISMLRGMLEDLNNPELQGGVLLLLLRFASEFMNRAVVFMVHDNVVSGVGQFGISGGKFSGDEIVRTINFALESDSMFSPSARTGRSSVFKPVLTAVDKHILKQLGGGNPDEVFIGPIVSKSRLVGFLYGDNLPDNQPINGTETLEIFISQVGFAMEQNILERYKV